MLISDKHARALIGASYSMMTLDSPEDRELFNIPGNDYVRLMTPVFAALGGHEKEINAAPAPPVEQITIVETSEISAYVDDLWGDHYQSDLSKDYPTIVSPWPYAIFEYRMNDGMRAGTRAHYMVAAFICRKTDYGFKQLITFYADYDREGVRFPTPLLGVFVEADHDGAFIRGRSLGRDTLNLSDNTHFLLACPFTTISLLHCKNVTTQDHSTPPKVARKRREHGKPVGVTYKTLNIYPMKQAIQRTITKPGVKPTMKRALHVCRGHFAKYTEEKPLFGKFVGTIWVPQHARGIQEAGEIRKNYKIRRPKNAEADSR